jgi:hypothetical protein
MSSFQPPANDSHRCSHGYQQRPEYRGHFHIAIVCALPLEYDAVTLLIDEFWDETGDPYGGAVGDSNSYTTGRISLRYQLSQKRKGWVILRCSREVFTHHSRRSVNDPCRTADYTRFVCNTSPMFATKV